MRILFTILTLFTAVSLQAQDSKVPLTDVLQEIEDKFQVRFAYDYQLAATSSVYKPDYSRPLKEVLTRTFKDSDLTFQSGNRVIIVKPRIEVGIIQAVELDPVIQLSGFVRDKTSGEPLQNSTLQVLSTGQYATTDLQGFFILNDVPYDTSRIAINYLGYHSLIIKPGQFESSQVKIQLVAKPAILDPVVVNDQVETFSLKSDAGAISMNPGNLQLFSNFGQPDIIRGIQLLPGVDGSSESSSGMSIRGGSADQNLVLFDGYSVFNLGHFFGTLSAFNANVISNVDLLKGGFGAQYGSRVSSVLDIESKVTDFDGKTRGSVGIDLMSLNMMVETAVTYKVSFMIAGRRSYTDLIQSNVFNNITNNLKKNRSSELSELGTESFIKDVDPEFGYYDVNAKLNVKLKEGQELGISFYNSGDHLSVIDNQFLDNELSDVYYDEQFKELTAWGNTGASIIYQYQWTPLLTSNVTLAHSSSFRSHELDYFLDFNGDGFSYYEDLNVKDKNLISETSFRLDNQYQIDRNSLFEFGIFSTRSNIEYHNSFDLNVKGESLQEKANQMGLYAQHTYSPIAKLSLTGGLRGTYYSGTDNTYLEPRVSLSYKPIPTVNFKGAVGRYYQFISQVTSNNPFVTQQAFWLVSDGLNVATIRSNHFIGGVTFETDVATIDIEGYYKTLDGLTTYALDSGFQDLISKNQSGALYRGSGRVRGMDVMVSRDFGALSSFVSYSLSYVNNKFQNVNNGFEYSANQDQRHELKWVNSVKAGNWEFSSTFVYGSGRPYTGFPFETGESVQGNEILNQLVLGGIDPNNLRIPAYHRLDLGIAYSKKFGKFTGGKMGMTFFNFYNRTNIQDIRYNYDVNVESEQLIVGEKRLKLLEFTPSLYINYYF